MKVSGIREGPAGLEDGKLSNRIPQTCPTKRGAKLRGSDVSNFGSDKAKLMGHDLEGPLRLERWRKLPTRRCKECELGGGNVQDSIDSENRLARNREKRKGRIPVFSLVEGRGLLPVPPIGGVAGDII
jgi:hypothetical protein